MKNLLTGIQEKMGSPYKFTKTNYKIDRDQYKFLEETFILKYNYTSMYQNTYRYYPNRLNPDVVLDLTI